MSTHPTSVQCENKLVPLFVSRVSFYVKIPAPTAPSPARASSPPLFHCVFGRLMFLCFASRRCAHVFVGSYPGMHEQLPRHCRCLWDLLPCVRELLDRNYRVLPGSLRRQPQHRNVQPCRRMLGPRRAIFVHHGRHWRLHYDGRLL